MFIIIGLVVVFGSIIGGFLMHHGPLLVLVQPNEFLIIGGAGIGSFIVGNPPAVLKETLRQIQLLLKPSPYNEQAYGELLQALYDVFQKARKDGLVGLEAHIEEPEKSEIFKKYPGFMHHDEAVAMLCDTLKVLLTGAVEDHHLEAILDADLEQQHHEAMVVPAAISKVADAMPGFGIVAAVLGVIVTMASIGGAASEIGEKVAAVPAFLDALDDDGLGRLLAHDGCLLGRAAAREIFERGK